MAQPARPGRAGRLLTAAVILLLVAAIIIAARKRRQATFSASRPMLGTIVSVTVGVHDRNTASAHLAAAFDRVAELEKALSAQDEKAELARINRSAGGEPVKVSEDLFRAVAAGVGWHNRSRGCFDIAAGPLIRLWQSCGRENRLPAAEELARARSLCGANRVTLEKTGRRVRIPVSGMSLHLGGLGKGYCADAVAALLRARGVASALICMSGDIYALGKRPDGASWRVGVQDPRRPDDPSALITVLRLHDEAVSTSGNYQRYVTIGGKKYSHIVDPRTGRTAQDVPGVTVIGPDTLTTDILGTALSVMGTKDGLQFVESYPGIEALFINFADRDIAILTRSSGFLAYEVKDKRAPDYRR